MTEIYTAPYLSFGIDDREALRNLVRRVLRPQCKILEIGSWLGTGSTQVILEELSGIDDAVLYCVDTWKGSPNVAKHQQIVANYDVLATFRHNIRSVGGEGKVAQLVMSSQAAADIVADEVFDLVFIDGDHSYIQTRNDISAWASKVRPGGILCGHDCEIRLNGTLREQIVEARECDHISGSGTPFAAVHPGVVIAVDEAFSGKAHLWAEEVLVRPDGTQGRATIWDVVMSGA